MPGPVTRNNIYLYKEDHFTYDVNDNIITVDLEKELVDTFVDISVFDTNKYFQLYFDM